MKVTFVSNYINHHQIPVSNRLYEQLKDDYCFVETQPMEEERIKMGWNANTGELPYLKRYGESLTAEEYQKLMLGSDIVVFGGVDDESFIVSRLEAGKIVIRYSERLYKEGQWKAISPRGLKKKYHDHTRYQKASVYLLCAGGYVADDFAIVNAYKHKRFKWGYFPAFEPSDATSRAAWKSKEKDGKNEEVACEENKNNKECVNILWAGRMIDWKHTSDALQAIAQIKEEDISFHLNIIGDGELRQDLETQAQNLGLSELVTFHGAKRPEEVREAMKKADIFLFTSDYKEGWGAVLNEAMNSGCAVIASHAIGAVPYLLEDNKNGLIYRSGDVTQLADEIRLCCMDATLRRNLGEAAYETIALKWNPNVAADALVRLCKNLLAGNVVFEEDGPLSEAPRIRQGQMYRYLKKG